MHASMHATVAYKTINRRKNRQKIKFPNWISSSNNNNDMHSNWNVEISKDFPLTVNNFLMSSTIKWSLNVRASIH